MERVKSCFLVNEHQPQGWQAGYDAGPRIVGGTSHSIQKGLKTLFPSNGQQLQHFFFLLEAQKG